MKVKWSKQVKCMECSACLEGAKYQCYKCKAKAKCIDYIGADEDGYLCDDCNPNTMEDVTKVTNE